MVEKKTNHKYSAGKARSSRRLVCHTMITAHNEMYRLEKINTSNNFLSMKSCAGLGSPDHDCSGTDRIAGMPVSIPDPETEGGRIVEIAKRVDIDVWETKLYFALLIIG